MALEKYRFVILNCQIPLQLATSRTNEYLFCAILSANVMVELIFLLKGEWNEQVLKGGVINSVKMINCLEKFPADCRLFGDSLRKPRQILGCKKRSSIISPIRESRIRTFLRQNEWLGHWWRALTPEKINKFESLTNGLLLKKILQTLCVLHHRRYHHDCFTISFLYLRDSCHKNGG
jgi:hypothetical protein